MLVGSTLDDVLTGNDGAQQLFGNAGFDRVDGLGGDDMATSVEVTWTQPAPDCTLDPMTKE